ncbi:hypothetical protein [Prochlorococcus marinus]|uniref:hypothetical protein n=1 Tax=Prochlorococcus marinus TaxID=1219 RepID=UPI0022B4E751|nr:hypothetical protein [Prochlorococcus marinus]
MKIKLIPNENLDLEKIPNPEDKSSDYQETWMGFALTMNAYEVCGDSETAFETRSKVLKDPLNASLTELRCALFVLQRHHRWNSPYSDPEDKRVIELLKLIRAKVKKGELE